MVAYRTLQILGMVAVASSMLAASASGDKPAEAPQTQVSAPQNYVDLAKFLQTPAVRRELKLTDAQLSELTAIEQETKRRITEIFENVDRDSQEDKQRAMQEINKELALSRELCSQVFTPEQRPRVQQLAFQYISRNAPTGYGLLTKGMIKELSITEEQAATIRAKADAIAKELKARDEQRKAEIEALRVKLHAELIESLDPAQRARAKELFGELIPLD
jgi:uncharacterized phage infection (PIP) family protein YhgE